MYTVSNFSKKVVELGEGMKENYVILIPKLTCDRRLFRREARERKTT